MIEREIKDYVVAAAERRKDRVAALSLAVARNGIALRSDASRNCRRIRRFRAFA
jgi:hypothetical protein